jgi:hypothetical protein
MYATGRRGVPQDRAEGVKWYRKAAEQGDARAQFALGLAYYLGEGVPKDYTEGIKWNRKAAEQGNGGAKDFLALTRFKKSERDRRSIGPGPLRGGRHASGVPCGKGSQGRDNRPRKQRVGPPRQPVGDEADPLLRDRVEIPKGRGSNSVRGE